jgi:lipoprotein-anchoring transpeptidase ErfK/SrfK
VKHIKEQGQHRAQPARRRAAPQGKRRADVQPRYGRIAVFTASAVVTAIAVLGGFGLLPSGPEDASAASGAFVPSAVEDKPEQRDDTGSANSTSNQIKQDQHRVIPSFTVNRRTAPPGGDTPALPADSGSGQRIVFSEGQQRVWLVDGSGEVLRSYLVSGSATDNLDPGTYEVYSRSRWAVGIDDSGTMQYFVRFTHGDAGAAIGFHTIPVDDGTPVQTVDQLGTPLSHGCVRQRTADAIALWDFAPIGTTVVVTA